jgi:hypothetical protein
MSGISGRDLNVLRDLNYLNYLRPVRASKFSIEGVVVQTQSKIGNPKSQIASLPIALFVMLLLSPNLADASAYRTSMTVLRLITNSKLIGKA